MGVPLDNAIIVYRLDTRNRAEDPFPESVRSNPRCSFLPSAKASVKIFPRGIKPSGNHQRSKQSECARSISLGPRISFEFVPREQRRRRSREIENELNFLLTFPKRTLLPARLLGPRKRTNEKAPDASNAFVVANARSGGLRNLSKMYLERPANPPLRKHSYVRTRPRYF